MSPPQGFVSGGTAPSTRLAPQLKPPSSSDGMVRPHSELRCCSLTASDWIMHSTVCHSACCRLTALLRLPSACHCHASSACPSSCPVSLPPLPHCCCLPLPHCCSLSPHCLICRCHSALPFRCPARCCHSALRCCPACRCRSAHRCSGRCLRCVCVCVCVCCLACLGSLAPKAPGADA